MTDNEEATVVDHKDVKPGDRVKVRFDEGYKSEFAFTVDGPVYESVNAEFVGGNVLKSNGYTYGTILEHTPKAPEEPKNIGAVVTWPGVRYVRVKPVGRKNAWASTSGQLYDWSFLLGNLGSHNVLSEGYDPKGPF